LYISKRSKRRKKTNKQTKKATSDQNIQEGKDGDPHKVERKKLGVKAERDYKGPLQI